MDTSKKYIKMCEEAPKELWNKIEHYGSLIAWRSFIGIVMPDPDKTKWEGLASVIPETLVLRTWLKEGKESIVVLKTNVDYGGSDGDRGTPLYRQDQLQEMLGKPIWNLVWDFERFTEDMTDPSCFELESMEQLWLGFIMKEKYSKQWINGGWIENRK